VQEKLSNSRLILYGLTDMPVMMSIFPAMVFIPRFYSSDMGVSLALVGTIIFAVRILDVFTDPLMGYLSDRTTTRFGRRRPWVVLATPIMMLSIWRLYMPPEHVDGWYMFGWMVVLSLGTTMMLIPYYAWGAELSTDYHERSRITGWRAALGALGQLTAQVVPAIALFFFAIGGTGAVLELVGTTMLIIFPIAVLLTVIFTPEPAQRVTSSIPILPGLKLMLKNGPFLRLIAAFMIGSIGLNISTPLYIFFVADVLGAENESIYMLSIFYLSSIFSIPIWVRLSSSLGKHKAYIAAYFTIALTHPFYLLLGEGDFWWMLPMTLVTGFAAGGFSQTLPNSMKADVIDLDNLQSGENRAALFFSAWSFAQKATASIGGAIAMFGLALWGFDPAPEAMNGESPMFGLRFLFSTFPSLFFLSGAIIIWKYPITEERHAQIRAELAARDGAGTVSTTALT
jgi:GPH family glycoside/pentoside/hexuronide:cation symporter